MAAGRDVIPGGPPGVTDKEFKLSNVPFSLTLVNVTNLRVGSIKVLLPGPSNMMESAVTGVTTHPQYRRAVTSAASNIRTTSGSSLLSRPLVKSSTSRALNSGT